MFYYYIEIKRNLEVSQTTLEEVQKINNEKSKLDELYGISNIKFEKLIKRKIVEHRIKTNANIVLFFGLHNGQTIGNKFHAKRMSLISEDHPESLNINSIDINTFHVALFALSIDNVLTNDLYLSHVDNVEEISLKSFMRSYNGHYIIASPVKFNHTTPMGIIFTIFDKFESDKLENDNIHLATVIDEHKVLENYLEFLFDTTIPRNNVIE